MDDKKLLELAAKAAGMRDWVWRDSCQALAHRNNAMGCFYTAHNGDAITWNPLQDDGAALRLAVKLNISINPGDGGTVTASLWNYGFEFLHIVEIGDEKVANARRAIVRAAAEIGGETP